MAPPAAAAASPSRKSTTFTHSTSTSPSPQQLVCVGIRTIKSYTHLLTMHGPPCMEWATGRPYQRPFKAVWWQPHHSSRAAFPPWKVVLTVIAARLHKAAHPIQQFARQLLVVRHRKYLYTSASQQAQQSAAWDGPAHRDGRWAAAGGTGTTIREARCTCVHWPSKHLILASLSMHKSILKLSSHAGLSATAKKAKPPPAGPGASRGITPSTCNTTGNAQVAHRRVLLTHKYMHEVDAVQPGSTHPSSVLPSLLAPLLKRVNDAVDAQHTAHG